MNQTFKREINQKRTLWAMAFAIIVGCLNFIMFSSSSFTQISLILQFVCLLVAFALNCYSTRYLVLVFITCSLCIINSMVNGSGYGSAVNFINLILSFAILCSAQLNLNKLKKFDLFFFIMLSIILVIYSKKQGIYYVSLFNSENIMNPNGYATIVLACGMLVNIILSRLRIKTNFIRFILASVSFAVFAIVLYKTGARTSLGCYFIYEVLCLYYFVLYKSRNRRFKDKTVFKGIVFSLIISFVAVGAYLILYQITDADFMILGKKLFSGRQNVWNDAFEQIKNNLIFGISNTHLFAGEYLNAHNGFIAILSYFGIVPFILFIYIVCKSFAAAPSKNGFNYNVYKCFAVAIFFLVSTFESFIIDGTFYFLIIPFLLNKEKYNDTKDDSLLLVRES